MIDYTLITDFEAPELDVYARLTEAQLLNRFEPKKGMFIAESPKVIGRALDAGCVPVSFLVERNHVNAEAEEVITRCGNIPVYTAELGEDVGLSSATNSAAILISIPIIITLLTVML